VEIASEPNWRTGNDFIYSFDRSSTGLVEASVVETEALWGQTWMDAAEDTGDSPGPRAILTICSAHSYGGLDPILVWLKASQAAEGAKARGGVYTKRICLARGTRASKIPRIRGMEFSG